MTVQSWEQATGELYTPSSRSKQRWMPASPRRQSCRAGFLDKPGYSLAQPGGKK